MPGGRIQIDFAGSPEDCHDCPVQKAGKAEIQWYSVGILEWARAQNQDWEEQKMAGSSPVYEMPYSIVNAYGKDLKD